MQMATISSIDVVRLRFLVAEEDAELLELWNTSFSYLLDIRLSLSAAAIG
jgi:hypothetical protein